MQADVDIISSFPHPLLAYQRWLDQRRDERRGPRDYLFSEERSRFEPRKEDVVVPLSGLSVGPHEGGARVSAEPGIEVMVDELSSDQVKAIVGAMDGERCLLEVGWAAQVDEAVLARFLRQAFGRVVFAPSAVQALEERLSATQIVRFPSAPYAVQRSYWENMVAVREELAGHDSPPDVEEFTRFLRRLHVLTLMGPNLDRFYQPASPVADETVAPGALYRTAWRLLETKAGPIYLDGPRVKVPHLGGLAYHEALAESLEDPEALASSRIFDGADAPWGRVVTARSAVDPEPTAMFLPPRPLQVSHFEHLLGCWRAALEAAESADSSGAVIACADFHQAWVRLHPFQCANQSLAMNLVNAVLQRIHGAGIPHLVLDHLALRFSRGAYREVFGRAVRHYAESLVGAVGLPAAAAARLAWLEAFKRRSYAVIGALGQGLSLGEVCAQDPDGAAAALLRS